MLEKTLQAQIKKFLVNEHDALVVKTDAVSQVGFPDLTVVLPGRVLFIEVKTPTGRLSKRQEIMIRWLAERGAEVYVVRSVNDVQKILAK